MKHKINLELEAIEEMKSKGICELKNISHCPMVESPECPKSCNWYEEYFEQICVWREMYKDRKQMAEGKLRHCQLYCTGFVKTCENYESLKTLNDYRQL